MNNELISVIIPIYNVENYLYDSIQSVLRQTYKNIELILIDDGSTDESLSICKKFQIEDKRIKIITQSNQGISYTRNVGLREAAGKYIIWVDSDDYIKKDMIEKLYYLIKKNDADMSICNYIKGSDRDYKFQDGNGSELIFDGKQGLDYLYKDNHFSFIMAASWCKLIKKSLYEGLEYPNGKLFEDIYMSHYLIQRCQKIVFIDQIMYYYYQWSESILGTNFHIGKLDYLDWFKERIAFFKKLHYDELQEKARLQYLHALMWEYSRVKDILHDNDCAKKIVKEYKENYTFGTYNPLFTHETKWYMLKFYISPYLTNLLDKVKSKLGVG